MPEAARGVLGDSATWAEPPDGVVDAVLASIRAAAPAPSALAARSPSWRPLVAATAAMAAVVLFIAFTGGTHGPAGHTTVVAAQGSDLAPDLMGTVSIRPTGSGWWIQLEVVDLPPAPAGAYYEGWVWSGGEGVSVGTFHMRGEPGPVILWSGVDLQDYPLLTVTLQQEGEGLSVPQQAAVSFIPPFASDKRHVHIPGLERIKSPRHEPFCASIPGIALANQGNR